MNEIIKIISERDFISEAEAKKIVEDALEICRNQIMEYDIPSEIEESWIEETGLEPHYLYDVLYSYS